MAATLAIRDMEPSAGLDDVITLLQLAAGLQRAGRITEASDYYRKVLLLEPGHPDALHLLGVAEHQNGNHEHGARLIERSVAIAPDPQKWHNLGVVREKGGYVEAAIVAYRQALRGDPFWIAAASNLLFLLDLHPYQSGEQLLAARREFDAQFCRSLTEAAEPHTNSLDPNRKLKIGYVSGDFKVHSAAMAFSPFLLAHDHRKFEVHLFSNGPQFDEMSEKFRQGADVWHDVQGLPDEELARIIRSEKIDILIDLSGYSALMRLLTFARRPAPIQITGWGYATGTGLACMDYLVGDPVVVPEESERFYSEQIIRLPSLLCYDAGENLPEVGPLPMLSSGMPMFGYIGRGSKLNPPVLAAWAEIMRRVPDAGLMLKGEEYREPEFRRRVMDQLVGLGVDERRVKILVGTSRRDHLATYNNIDVMLDPWPNGSGVTALDAAYMGVPIVTRRGDLIPSAIASSIMAQLEVADPITTRAEYVERAVRWANDIPFLEQCRKTLRGRMQRSIIMDGETYCRRWEAALTAVWREYCSRQKKVQHEPQA